MDNFQAQSNNQTTSNLQPTGLTSIASSNSNLQGSVGNQEQLLKLPASGLQVTVCHTDCRTTNLQPAPTKSSNNTLAIGLTALIVVLLVLVWRFVVVIRRATTKRPVEEIISEPLEEISATSPVIAEKKTSKKSSKKQSKKRKR